jgi:hypothetical protein
MVMEHASNHVSKLWDDDKLGEPQENGLRFDHGCNQEISDLHRLAARYEVVKENLKHEAEGIVQERGDREKRWTL